MLLHSGGSDERGQRKLHHIQLIHQDLFLAKSNGDIIEMQFFLWRRRKKSVEGPWCAAPLTKSHCLKANPANTKSRSTSCEAGVSPSAPTEPGSPRKVSATARAAVQDNKALQRKRQPCSARRRKSNPSQRARSRARVLMKCCVVGDHLPSTSTARTTRRDLARRPTSSGYLRSFRRSAMEIATPSPGGEIAVQRAH